MTEPERINNIEEQIDLAGLLLGVDLSCLPPEESMKLKRSALDLYRLGHASGFKAGVDHATSATAAVMKARRGHGGPPRLNRTRQHWDTRRYSTGSGSDRAPAETPSPQGARSLPLPVLYQWRLVQFRRSSKQ